MLKIGSLLSAFTILSLGFYFYQSSFNEVKNTKPIIRIFHSQKARFRSPVKIKITRADGETKPILKNEDVVLRAHITGISPSMDSYSFSWSLNSVNLISGTLQGSVSISSNSYIHEITIQPQTDENQFIYFSFTDARGLIKRVQFNTIEQSNLDKKRQELKENYSTHKELNLKNLDHKKNHE